MASIVPQANGRLSIQFSYMGKRPTVRLGVCNRKQANEFLVGLERLLSEREYGHPPSPQTVAWLEALTERTRNRLVKIGVLRAEPGRQLKPFLDYVFSRLDVKQSTVASYSQPRDNLLEFFGPEKDITELTPGDADSFRIWVKTQNKMRKDGVMAPTTVSKRCLRARQFFEVAVRHRWIRANPFEGMKGWTTTNPDRMFFVTREITKRVMGACDPEWQLIFALCRYGGLRCPSEVNGLKWAHINWENNSMFVKAPKTARYAGKDARFVPIFHELRPYLEQAWEVAPAKAKYVVNRRCSGQALTSQLEKILKRAHVQRWGKLFQNLRSTRETELQEEYPQHVVCAWIGNSPQIANRHYLQITKDHIARAVERPRESSAKNDALNDRSDERVP